MGTPVRLDRLLKQVDPSVKMQVERTVRRFREPVHEFLADGTRLQLRRGAEGTKVSILVRPGHPSASGA